MPRFLPARRTLIPAIVLIVAAPVAAFVLAPAPVVAADTLDQGPGAGTLMLRSLKATDALPAIRLGTDMNVTVTGSVARVRVTQAFRNTSDKWMEATYLYPLPEDSAV